MVAAAFPPPFSSSADRTKSELSSKIQIEKSNHKQKNEQLSIVQLIQTHPPQKKERSTHVSESKTDSKRIKATSASNGAVLNALFHHFTISTVGTAMESHPPNESGKFSNFTLKVGVVDCIRFFNSCEDGSANKNNFVTREGPAEWLEQHEGGGPCQYQRNYCSSETLRCF